MSPQNKQAIILNHENPDEASSIELPLISNIPPAKVHTKAASKRRMRFETVKVLDFDKFIFTIKTLIY